jgi:hypothetical protein
MSKEVATRYRSLICQHTLGTVQIQTQTTAASRCMGSLAALKKASCRWTFTAAASSPNADQPVTASGPPRQPDRYLLQPGGGRPLFGAPGGAMRWRYQLLQHPAGITMQGCSVGRRAGKKTNYRNTIINSQKIKNLITVLY